MIGIPKGICSWARVWVVLGVTVALTMLVIWSLVPWVWSTIDDPGLVGVSRKVVDEVGPFWAPFELFQREAAGDLRWGLFRPAYWVYPLVYLLPVEAVHVLRLLMFAVAYAGPLVYLMRERRRSPAVLVGAAAVMAISMTALSRGLFFLSLQELSGAAFVGLGLLARGKVARTVFWLVAAWFKSPFSWLLLGHALILWRRGSRRAAVVNALLGVGTLVAALAYSQSGAYTGGYLRPTLWGNIEAAFQNSQNFLGVLGGALLLAVVWWVVSAEGALRMTPIAYILAIGFAGYSAQMLLWETSGYYFGPILYLAGATLTLALWNSHTITRVRLIVSALVPWSLALLLLGGSIQQGLETNSVIRSIGECLLKYPDSRWALTGYYLNVINEEGSVRVRENAQLEDSSWTGSVSFMADGSQLTRANADFVIAGPNSSLPPSVDPATVCEGTQIVVYRLQG